MAVVGWARAQPCGRASAHPNSVRALYQVRTNFFFFPVTHRLFMHCSLFLKSLRFSHLKRCSPLNLNYHLNSGSRLVSRPS